MSRNSSRASAAILVATLSILFPLGEHFRVGGHRDFGLAWFGARAMLHGIDPYPLVGPGRPFDWDWHLYYPATTMVVVLPLALLPELMATLAFVWISAALLTYALTERGWERIWILPSAAFIVAVRAAQWSPIFSAAYLLAPLAAILIAKPTLGAAIVAGSPSLRTLSFAVFGGVVLLTVSLALLPSWPAEWFELIRRQSDLGPPVAWTGGVFILLALFRWRLPEARLLAGMGLVPLTASWYEALPLLLIGKTKRECQVLSMISSLGYILQISFVRHGFIERQQVRALMLVFCFAPALFVVLRRPNLTPAAETSALDEKASPRV